MKIKYVKFIILYYLCFICQVILSQEPIYFNNRYDLTGNSLSDGVYSTIETDDGYVFFANIFEGFWYTAILSLDFEGMIKDIKITGDGYSDYITGYPGSLIKYDNAIYYTIGLRRIYTSTWVHDQGLLMCYNNNMDTLWSHYYGEVSEPYDTAFIFSQINKTNDGGLIITGGWKPEGLPSHMYLLKTNKYGDKQWDNSFGFSTWYYLGYSVIQTSDGGYAIGGYRFLIGNINSGDPIVIKTDSVGKQQWFKNIGGPYVDNIAMVTLAADGNILIGTNYAFEMSGYDPKSKINIIKLDNQGNVIWNKMYGDITLNNYLNNIHSLSDGSIICGGDWNPTGIMDVEGWALKVNSDGDSLWLRVYRLLFGNSSLNYLYDIIQTTDDGFIACGYIHPAAPDTGTEDVWVIKVDSLGCEGPDDCWVGMEEKPEKRMAGKTLEIYPNPAGYKLQVAGYRLQRDEYAVVTFFDSYGHKVFEMTVPPSQKEISVDVSDWHEGLYAVILLQNGRTAGSGKVVVMR